MQQFSNFPKPTTPVFALVCFDPYREKCGAVHREMFQNHKKVGCRNLTIIIVQVLGWYAYNSRKPNNSGKTIIQWVISSQNTPVYESTNSTCPTVHIAMIFPGHTESWNVYLALKSILMHRSTKLHFHFITDNRTKIVLKTILSSWLVPGITHDYYALYSASEIIRRKFADSPTMATCF